MIIRIPIKVTPVSRCHLQALTVSGCHLQVLNVENFPKPKEQLPENSLPVYLLKTGHEIRNNTDKKGHYVQTCENAHPKNISESKTHSNNTTSAKNNPIKGTEPNMENTNLEDTTSLSETNKTTEKEFPTP